MRLGLRQCTVLAVLFSITSFAVKPAHAQSPSVTAAPAPQQPGQQPPPQQPYAYPPPQQQAPPAYPPGQYPPPAQYPPGQYPPPAQYPYAQPYPCLLYTSP